MSKPASQPPPPEPVLTRWWAPFAEFLEKERRYSAYTLRNYRQAFDDFYRWLVAAGLWERGFDKLGTRELRDFVIEAQSRFDRRTLHNHVQFSVWTHRLFGSLMAVFAVLALIIAAVGLYGVMAYSVAQRSREIGIRMALGAQAADVRSLVVSQVARLGATGLAVGIAGALTVTRVLDSLLFGVTATDPLTFGAVSAALVAVLLLASYLPARRATRVDPIVALRAD